MQKKRWALIESILDTALTLIGNERSTYIEQACSNDAELLEEVYALLEAVEESERTHFLEGVLDESNQLIKDFSDHLPSDDHWIGTRVGAYKIIEQLGSGGMGAVYKAERADGQFTQQVAIKLLQQGIRSEETIRRFRMEQEILASLKHANIAQLYDGGITDNGIPYLVMEYVDGVPINQYCNKHKLTIDQRITLFKDVCKAVQFAHANLVIHRDLKAQNIYVTAEGQVKVLDFGIAKLLNPKLTEKTLLQTLPGQKFWTPQYAAPEQVKGNPITTATDVYALGVLLHKLLTGTYPLDLKNKSIGQVERIITEEAPILMSQATKKTELRKILSGDLEALVLKSLRKEPEYRYNSVGLLIEELDRYQNGLPLTARRDTFRYRIGKFYRRHKTVVAVSIILIFAVAALTTFYTYRITVEKEVALNEANKSRQIALFLTDLFQASDPNIAAGETLTALDLLNQGIENINQLDQQSIVKAEMLSLISKIYLRLGSVDKVSAPIDTALKIYEKKLNIEDSSYISTLYTKALYMREIGKMDSAIFLLNQAGSKSKNISGRTNRETINIYRDLSFTLRMENKLDTAEVIIEEMLELQQELYKKTNSDITHMEISASWYVLASILRDLEKLDEAEQAQLNSLKIIQQYNDGPHPGIIANLNGLALIKRERMEYQQALNYFEDSYEMCFQVYGEKNPQTATSLFNIGELYILMGNWTEAKKYLDKSLVVRKEILPSNHPLTTKTEKLLDDIKDRIK